MKKLLIIFLFTACQTPIPKPNGMLALDYSDANYTKWVSENCPYKFDYNSLSQIELQSNCFFSLSYPEIGAQLYMSYFDLEKHSIDDLYRDFNLRLMEHSQQQVRVLESSYENPPQNVYGRFFEVAGDAPSNLHYLVTDQKYHFMTGVLFFNTTPNYDSLYPAIQYIKTDLRYLTENLQWR